MCLRERGLGRALQRAKVVRPKRRLLALDSL
jgi:hypothetical protein